MQPQNDLLNIRGPNLIKFRLPKSTLGSHFCKFDFVASARPITLQQTLGQFFRHTCTDTLYSVLPADL